MKYSLLLLVLAIFSCSTKSKDMIHPSIRDFYTQVNSIKHELYLELPNDYVYLRLIRYKDLDPGKIHQTKIQSGTKFDDYKNVNNLIKRNHYGYEFWKEADFSKVNFDKESGFVLFHTFLVGYGQNVDIVTDRSGKIFKIRYYPSRERFAKIWFVADSIKEIIKDDISTMSLNNDIDGILVSNLIKVKDLLGHSIENRYPIGDLSFKKDYEVFFNQANNNTKTNVKVSIVDWIEYKDSNGTYINVVFKISEQKINVVYRKEKGEYIANLIDKVNSKLENIHSDHRLALVREKEWDSLHGLTILSKEEFEKLDRHLLIIHG